MNLNLKPERTLVRSLAIVFFACAAPWLNADSVTEITIDTSTLAGQTENLVLDFDLGGGTQSNTVSITNFYTDGTLSSIYQAHNVGVTGYLPGDLTFTSGTTVVEELYVTEILGNTITFDFGSTNNAPTAGAFPTNSMFICSTPPALRRYCHRTTRVARDRSLPSICMAALARPSRTLARLEESR